MYTRTSSVTRSARQERFAFSGSTEPEVFTFETVPAHATAVRSYVPVRPKRRCTRVMYPAKVRMHLPPPERSRAKRWLVALCLVVLWQIYTEDACAETQLSGADGPVGEGAGFHFRSAEEQARQLAALGASSELRSASASASASASGSEDQTVPDASGSGSCQDADGGRAFDQGAGNSYMVALLVYHRLGGDK